MKEKYKWKTSEALYELFCLIATQNKQKTVSEIIEIVKKDAHLVAEQIRWLEKEKILVSERKGKNKLVKINSVWVKKIFPRVKKINDISTYLMEFRSFSQLFEDTKNKGKYEIVESGKVKIYPAKLLQPFALINKLKTLEEENEKLRKELKKLTK